MRQAGLSGLVPKRRGRTTIRVPGVRVADDLVGRQFRPAAPNVLWLADITYLEPGSAPAPPEKSFAARSLTSSGSSTTPAPGRSLCADRMLGCRFRYVGASPRYFDGPGGKVYDGLSVTSSPSAGRPSGYNAWPVFRATSTVTAIANA
jgi:hypothetical protein